MGGLLLALPGLVPSLMLDWGVDRETAPQAHEIYVFERLPHHLILSGIHPEFILRLGLLWGVLVVGGAGEPTRRSASDDRRHVWRGCGRLSAAAVVDHPAGRRSTPLAVRSIADWRPTCCDSIGSA